MSFLHHDSDSKVARLQQLALFKNADHKALEHIANAADEVSIGAGTTLITQGQHHHEGYIIETGALSVHVDGDLVGTIGPGQVVGELSLFGHGPASATVTTTEPTTVLVIPYNRFDQILDEVPGLAKAIAIRLAARLHEMDAHHSDPVS